MKSENRPSRLLDKPMATVVQPRSMLFVLSAIVSALVGTLAFEGFRDLAVDGMTPWASRILTAIVSAAASGAVVVLFVRRERAILRQLAAETKRRVQAEKGIYNALLNQVPEGVSVSGDSKIDAMALSHHLTELNYEVAHTVAVQTDSELSRHDHPDDD
jgi:hypothetical protein